MKYPWLRVAVLNLFFAATIGALLRYAFVEEVSWMKFRYLLHAHSHVAMLGWIYLALYTLIFHFFVPDEKKRSPNFNGLFWITELSVIGMLISFPIQGYGLVSIAFSTLHIICSYFFVAWVWKDLPVSHSFSNRLLKTALVFMLISTLGVWLMGPIMSFQLRGSALYYMAVQFYLHFQFNGWFLFAVLALFFKLVEKRNVGIASSLLTPFYVLLVLASLFTYALAVAWSQPLWSVFFVNSLGVLLQLLALWFFLRIIWPIRASILLSFNRLEKALIRIAFLSFGAKIFVQASVVLPFVAEAAYTIRNYVIGFIHLILLGAISFFILAFSLQQKLFVGKKIGSQWGVGLMVFGFLSSEFLLFLQGSMLWGAKGFLPYYYELIFLASAFIPLGVLLFYLALKRKPNLPG